jgi:acyl-CoA-binding protein
MATKKEKPLKEQFSAAKARVEELSRRPTNEQLLDLYGLFKQATEGDVTGERPGLLDIRGRAKFDAWAKRKGASKDDAMKKYVALVGKLVPSRAEKAACG